MDHLRLFAILQNTQGGLAQVFCDGHQHFVFERSTHGVTEERTYSANPHDFHDYIRALGEAGWIFAWAHG